MRYRKQIAKCQASVLIFSNYSNVNGLNAPIKKQGLVKWILKQQQQQNDQVFVVIKKHALDSRHKEIENNKKERPPNSNQKQFT